MTTAIACFHPYSINCFGNPDSSFVFVISKANLGYLFPVDQPLIVWTILGPGRIG